MDEEFRVETKRNVTVGCALSRPLFISAVDIIDHRHRVPQ